MVHIVEGLDRVKSLIHESIPLFTLCIVHSNALLRIVASAMMMLIMLTMLIIKI